MKNTHTLLASAAAAALLSGPASAQQKIKIGNLVDYTGATSSVGKISGPGKVDALAWINKNGGINGKMLDVDTVDYSYQTQRSIQQYKKWKDEGALAIQGYGTNDTEAMVGFIAEDKIPYFSLSLSGHLTDPSGTMFEFFSDIDQIVDDEAWERDHCRRDWAGSDGPAPVSVWGPKEPETFFNPADLPVIGAAREALGLD